MKRCPEFRGTSARSGKNQAAHKSRVLQSVPAVSAAK